MTEALTLTKDARVFLIEIRNNLLSKKKKKDLVVAADALTLIEMVNEGQQLSAQQQLWAYKMLTDVNGWAMNRLFEIAIIAGWINGIKN